MIIATIAWALGEALMRRSSASDRLARAISTIGIALALTHVVLAFQLVYAWNHETARDSHRQAGCRSLRLGLARWNLHQLRLPGTLDWGRVLVVARPTFPFDEIHVDRNDAIRAVYLHVPQRRGDLRFRSRPPGRDRFSVNRDTRKATYGRHVANPMHAPSAAP